MSVPGAKTGWVALIGRPDLGLQFWLLQQHLMQAVPHGQRPQPIVGQHGVILVLHTCTQYGSLSAICHLLMFADVSFMQQTIQPWLASLCSAVPHSAVQHSAAWHSSYQYSTVHHDAAAQTAQHCTAQCTRAQHSTAQHSTAKHAQAN